MFNELIIEKYFSDIYFFVWVNANISTWFEEVVTNNRIFWFSESPASYGRFFLPEIFEVIMA